jgi:hypothetical protein
MLILANFLYDFADAGESMVVWERIPQTAPQHKG